MQVSHVQALHPSRESFEMTQLVVALAVVAALGIAFPSTRMIGVLAAAVLALLRPWAILALFVSGSAGWCLFNYLKKRRSNDEK